MMKKFVSVLLFSLVLNAVYPAYAAKDISDQSKKVILTVEEATEKAISYSYELKNMMNEEELAELNQDDTRRDLFYATEYADVTSLAVQFRNLSNTISNYEKNITLQKDKISLSVYNLFAAIIQCEDDIELYEKNMDIEERNLKIAETKLNLGLISQSDYDSEKISYDKSKSNLQTLKNSLDESYVNLSKIMGYDLATEYTITLDSTYEPIDRTIILSSKITLDTSSSLKIKEAEDNVTVKKYAYDKYSSIYSSEKEESVRNSYLSASRSAESLKTELAAQEKSIYNQIIDLETSYDTNKSQLEKLNSDFEIMKKQLELGQITQLEYDKAEYEIQNLEYTIKHQVFQHNALMMQFNNIDLVL